MKHYQAEQQVKYLYLQAEIDVLLQQLQTLKQHKDLTEANTGSRSDHGILSIDSKIII